MLVCPIAATAPKIIDATDMKIKIDCHSSKTFPKAIYKILIIAPKPATFGANAKNAVTEVGAPS